MLGLAGVAGSGRWVEAIEPCAVLMQHSPPTMTTRRAAQVTSEGRDSNEGYYSSV